jgi:hypothetical protein
MSVLTSVMYPTVMGFAELSEGRARGLYPFNVDCQGLPDYGLIWSGDTARYGEYFAERARTYDSTSRKHPETVINCHAGLHRSVSVAICWSVWRGACATPEEAEAHYLHVRGPAANPLHLYKPAIEFAIRILSQTE